MYIELRIVSIKLIKHQVIPLRKSSKWSKLVCSFKDGSIIPIKNASRFFLIWLLDGAGPAKSGGLGGHGTPTFFQSKKRKNNNNNRNKLKIHNIIPWIGQSICYYLNFIWFSPFVYVCKARAFFSCYCYRIQLFYLYKTW